MTKSTPQLQTELAAIQAEIKRREAVETASAAGYKIENKVHGGDVWMEARAAFCWSRYDYRVKPAPPKPRRIQWLEHGQAVQLSGWSKDTPNMFIELTPAVESCLREHGKGLL
jgi:hypothetical protein